MAHITTIGAGMFSFLSIATGDIALTTLISSAPQPGTLDAAGFQALFAIEGDNVAGGFTKVGDVRSFPTFGTPANISNVPVYGQAITQQVQGQANAPTLDITINYVPDDWKYNLTAGGSVLGNLVGDGVKRAFRFTLLNVDSEGVTANTQYADLTAGLGTVENSSFYWLGKVESILTTPNLTDANTAVVTLSMQSSFYGAFSIT